MEFHGNETISPAMSREENRDREQEKNKDYRRDSPSSARGRNVPDIASGCLVLGAGLLVLVPGARVLVPGAVVPGAAVRVLPGAPLQQ
jgi:hypothetical protein